MKRALCVLLAVLAAVCFVGCSDTTEKTDDIYVTDESYFSDFYIYDGSVYMICSLTICNTTGEGRDFVINARDEESFNNGLLSNPAMSAYHIDAAQTGAVTADMIEQYTPVDKVFTIGANQTQTYVIVFVGSAGKNSGKPNRELPAKIFIQDPFV